MESEKKAKKTFFRSTYFNLLLSFAGIISLILTLAYFVNTAFKREIKSAEDKTMLLVSTLRSDLELSYARFEDEMRFKVSYVPLAGILEDREISSEDILPLRKLYSMHHEIISRIWVLSPEMKGRHLTCEKDNYFKISEIMDYENYSSPSDAQAVGHLKIPYYNLEGKLLYHVIVEMDYRNFVGGKMKALSLIDPDIWLFYMSPSCKLIEMSHSQKPGFSFDIERRAKAEILAALAEGYDGTIQNKAMADNMNMAFISSFSSLSTGGKKGWIMVSLDKKRILASVYRVLVPVSSLFFLALLITIFVFAYFIVNINRTSKALQESEKRWVFAIEGSGDGVWDWNTVTNEVYYSKRWKEIIGYSENEIGNSYSEWKKRVHPDDMKKLAHILNSNFSGKTDVYRSEHRILGKAGNYIWVLDRGMVIDRDSKGSPLRMIGTHSDITQRKNAEEEIRRLSERLDLAIKSAGIGVWDWDIGGNRLIWDDRMKKLYGIDGMNSPAAIETWMEMIAPEDRKRIERGIRSAVAGKLYFRDEFRISTQEGGMRYLIADARAFLGDSGRPHRMVGISYDVTERKKSELELKRNSETANLIARMSAHFINIDSSSVDVAVSLSLGSIGTHLSIDAIRIFALSEDNSSVKCENEWVSAENADVKKIAGRMTSVASDSWWMHNISEFKNICIPDTAKTQAHVKGSLSFLEGEKVRSLLILPLAWRQKLERFICFSTVEKEWNPSEGEISLLQALEDVFLNASKRKEIESALIHNQEMLREMNDTLEQKVEDRTRKLKETQAQMFLQEKMASIGQLAAGIAHEINNPASFIATNFDSLVEDAKIFRELLGEYRGLLAGMNEKNALTGPGFDSAYRKILEKEKAFCLEYLLADIEKISVESKEGFARISDISSSMSDFSRADSVREMVAYNINNGINDTLVIAKNTYKYYADIILELGDIPDIPCCPGQLNQVFLNLIVNAAQAIASAPEQRKGIIKIRTWHESQHVYCMVSDDGPGIAPEVKNRIFEPFFTTKEIGKGTGLGLSISYDIIVVKHKGGISVESELGKGAEFLIRLPVFMEKEEPAKMKTNTEGEMPA
jgi:PAS domain S-box-containing protein